MTYVRVWACVTRALLHKHAEICGIAELCKYHTIYITVRAVIIERWARASCAIAVSVCVYLCPSVEQWSIHP